jgi:hypothetical protein
MKPRNTLKSRDGVKECTYLIITSASLDSGILHSNLEIAHAITSRPRLFISRRLDRRNFEMTGFMVGGGVDDEPKSGQSAKLQRSLSGIKSKSGAPVLT